MRYFFDLYHFFYKSIMPSVLYSLQSDAFSIPEEVELNLFKQVPPHIPVGATLFRKQDNAKFSEDLKTLQSSETLHWGFLILDRRPICDGYQHLKVRTIYSYPLLTSEPDAVKDSEAAFWSSYIQNTAGDIFSYDLEDSEVVRTCKALQDILKEKGDVGTLFEIADVPEDCEWEIEEDETGQEIVRVRPSVSRILKELLVAVDASRLPSDCSATTRALVAGERTVESLLS
jgi:hypothetical protein